MMRLFAALGADADTRTTDSLTVAARPDSIIDRRAGTQLRLDTQWQENYNLSSFSSIIVDSKLNRGIPCRIDG